jgi:hypothetical protein
MPAQSEIAGHKKDNDDDADDGEEVHLAAPLDSNWSTATVSVIERRRQVRKLLSRPCVGIAASKPAARGG